MEHDSWNLLKKTKLIIQIFMKSDGLTANKYMNLSYVEKFFWKKMCNRISLYCVEKLS